MEKKTSLKVNSKLSKKQKRENLKHWEHESKIHRELYNSIGSTETKALSTCKLSSPKIVFFLFIVKKFFCKHSIGSRNVCVLTKPLERLWCIYA